MIKEPLKIGEYYLIDLTWWKVKSLGKKRIGKCTKILNHGLGKYSGAFEFDVEVGIYNTRADGRAGYCLYIELENIIRKATRDEAMVSAL